MSKPSGRRILFADECERAANLLGGYKVIDASLDAVWDGLIRNPYAFDLVESDWFSFRYIVTKPIPPLPPLVWSFTIVNGDVIIVHVEEYVGY